VEGQVDGSVVNVAIAGVMGVIKFAGGTIRLWGCGGNATVRGYFRDFSTESVQVPYASMQVRTHRV
jgi:hypothetical protein